MLPDFFEIAIDSGAFWICLGGIFLKLFTIIRQNKFLKYQFPAILMVIAIFIQSSIPNLSAPDLGFKWQDKVAHLAEFSFLAFLLIRYFVFNSHVAQQKRWYSLTLIVGGLYAILDEIHQLMVPGRTSDILDVLADLIGVLIVINVFQLAKTKISMKAGNTESKS